jgi:16S rRNA (cytosine1402-N4)-methyltransferase
MQNTIHHIPVLKDEVIYAFKNLNHTNKDGYIIDCTCGFGGHSLALLENISNKNIKLICNDKDINALNFSKEFLKKYQDRIIFSKLSFSKLLDKYKNKKIIAILADIGVSSYQLDNNKRGFGFNSDFLDMRMDTSSDKDAKYILNTYTKTQLEKLFKQYDVREYKKISALIYENKPFTQAKELSQLIQKHSYKHKKHSATLVFQALRIEVNNELDELDKLLKSLEKLSKALILNNCQVALISFHSLEDKIIKNYFRNWSKKCICDSEAFKCECGNNNQKGIVLTKKPIIATKKEIKQNPRSSSAKMRVFSFNSSKNKKTKQR